MKHSRKKLCAFLALCFGIQIFHSCPVQAEPIASPHKTPDLHFPKPVQPPRIRQLHDPKYWMEQHKEYTALMNDTWADERWTGDDTPYAAARSGIEHAVASGQSPQSLLSQYNAQYRKEPKNPLALFRWAYAMRLALMSSDFPSHNSADTLNSTNIALAEASSPHAYNYVRLRYLTWISSMGGGASYFLRNLANHLLQKDPQDFPVKLGLATIYTVTGTKELQNEGYALTQQMIKDYPGKPEVYDMLGGWYYTHYLRYHAPEDYHMAMTNYQKALGMYPATTARKVQLPHIMQFLEKRHQQIGGD